MRECRNKKITFKPYEQEQLMMLDLGSMVPQNHVVRQINSAIDSMDIEYLLIKYMPGGTSTYNPRMMLKVLVFAYTQKIFSSRKIATSLKRDVYFMWLSGMNQPDFRTINAFRSNRMKDIIEKVLAQVVSMLCEQGYINFEDYFVDGTKIEANANKYTFVWKKSVEKYKAALETNVKKLMKEIDDINDSEEIKYNGEDLPENKPVSSEDIQKFSDELNKMLDELPEHKEIKKAKQKVDNDFLPRMKKYEEQLDIIGNDRNSYSKTDTDATFMRMKEDHMKNGQLKPGYNVQIGTQNQFILNAEILQDRNDNAALKPMIDSLNNSTAHIPTNVCADSGYGNEETYEFLENNNINNYVKYTYFHKEQKKQYRENKFLVGNFNYDEDNDEYICPADKRLKFKYNSKRITENNFEQSIVNYECEDCFSCDLKDKCTKSKGNRSITVNKNLNRHKNIARINLTSEKGLNLRSRRPIEVEAAFGNIKWNMGFKRFTLRGLKKVKIEWVLLCIAHNFNKLTNMKNKMDILPI